LRFFDFKVPDMAISPDAFYTSTEEILSSIRSEGMNFYEPYDVSGYEAYHQWPIYHRAWITPNSLTTRYAFIRSVIAAAEPGMFKVDVYNYVINNIPNGKARIAKDLIIELITYLLPMTDNLAYDPVLGASITDLRLRYFLLRFLQEFNESDWTNYWDAGNDLAELRSQLEFIFNAILQSPEYQLA
jgi:hypothetical protein